jgi:hypothetical protein
MSENYGADPFSSADDEGVPAWHDEIRVHHERVSKLAIELIRTLRGKGWDGSATAQVLGQYHSDLAQILFYQYGRKRPEVPFP